MGGVTSLISGTVRPAQFQLLSQGNNDHGQAGPNGAPLGAADYISTACGGVYHSLALTSLGEVFAWGCNLYGQIGNGHINVEDRKDAVTLPVQIQIHQLRVAVKVSKIAAGMGHTAVISESGQLYTWGLGSEGQLCYACLFDDAYVVPYTKERCQLTPKLVESMLQKPLENVACGKNFTLLLTAEKKIYVAGSGRWGVLGNGRLSDQSEPIAVTAGIRGEMHTDNRVSRIACGWSHCLAAVPQIGVFMWGQPYFDLETEQRQITTPTLMLRTDHREQIAALACGQNHSAAIVTNLSGRTHLFTWGSNAYGQLGYETFNCEDDISLDPMVVDSLSDENIHAVACGWNYTAAMVNEGKVMGWGGNKYYQFGEEKEDDHPATLPLDKQVNDVISGYSHLFFLTVPPNGSPSRRRVSSAGGSTDKMFMEDFFPKPEF